MRNKCWLYDCQLRRLGQSLKDKISFRAGEEVKKRKAHDALLCQGCELVAWCSEECKKNVMADGHRRDCGYLPYKLDTGLQPLIEQLRSMGLKSEGLDVMYGTHEQSPVAAVGDACGFEGLAVEDDSEAKKENDGDGDEESSCWESLDSEESEEEKVTISSVIHDFFYERAYKYQQPEEPPFAQFFTNE